jgi:hypothetical protein
VASWNKLSGMLDGMEAMSSIGTSSCIHSQCWAATAPSIPIIKSASSPEAPFPFPRQQVDGWDAAGCRGGSDAQICCALLFKLTLDLWLHCSTADSFAMTLVVLRRCLSSPKPDVRARAFDIVYNLSCHGELLFPSELEASMARVAGGILNGAATSDGSSDDGAEAALAAAAAHLGMEPFTKWLRLLTFELLQMIAEARLPALPHDSCRPWAKRRKLLRWLLGEVMLLPSQCTGGKGPGAAPIAAILSTG